MGLLSKALIFLSIIQLLHSGFSSSEFQQLLKTQQNTGAFITNGLPLDIKLEVYMAMTLFVAGIFLSFDKIKHYPIQENTNIIETGEYLSDIKYRNATNIENITGSNSEGEVIYTANIIDVHQKRKECRDWVLKNSQ